MKKLIKRTTTVIQKRRGSAIRARMKSKVVIARKWKRKVSLIRKKKYKQLVFSNVAAPLVSIIIPVHNHWKYTYACLKSIREQSNDIPYEIVIADDVSTDETSKMLLVVKNIRLIRNKTKRGFLLNCNRAARKARGKYLLFLNNDTVVTVDWLKHLTNLMENDPKIGLAGVKLVYPNGKLQEAGGIIFNDGSGWNYGRTDDPEKPQYNYVKEVDYISGAGIMIRTDLWRTIGGFDRRFKPAYYEDVDLAFEVRKRGYKVVFQPLSRVVHFEGVSHGKRVISGIKRFQAKNKKKFYVKWKETLVRYHSENGKNIFGPGTDNEERRQF